MLLHARFRNPLADERLVAAKADQVPLDVQAALSQASADVRDVVEVFGRTETADGQELDRAVCMYLGYLGIRLCLLQNERLRQNILYSKDFIR